MRPRRRGTGYRRPDRLDGNTGCAAGVELQIRKPLGIREPEAQQYDLATRTGDVQDRGAVYSIVQVRGGGREGLGGGEQERPWLGCDV